MDEHKHKILVTLVFFMTILHIINVVVALQELAFHQHYSAMMMMIVFIMEANIVTKEIFVWNYELTSDFMERELLGSYLTKMFKQRIRLILKTFHYLCNIIVPSLGRAYSHMRSCILVKTQVAIALFCLSSNNTLQMCGEVYG
jgi:hypothetical protein